ncbi:methylglyoxal synthase [Leadbetterella byssophila DSM 17132]|uniref:Methylglyoxal synthase n=1 Tax=Leadbetterella byssophila (strain DSM 17132 / JCM 16389 / KACC 11308 / NBRC 106382 / 4M15) TaxID=649349 RepID=E4RTP1_LEAB4|nr:methylglyoxal synthase [Leadbetterella byssophila]ADQ16898.1 methylglyoxal synthase [Leadbetterella byssophila DSM 17132]
MIRTVGASKNIALVAHDNKKDDILQWALSNRHILKNHTLLATGTTGKLLEQALELPVRKLLSGPLGGDQQIGSLIAEGKVDILIFFWDPMQSQPHDPDVKALLRLGVVWNIPMACDTATANLIFSSPLINEEYTVKLTDYEDYKNRVIK